MNSDRLRKLWLSRFGSTVAGRVADTVSDRLASPLAGAQVTVGGFDGEAPADAGNVRMGGNVTTGILGAVAQWNRLLDSVAISVSEGEDTFDQPGVDKGKIESAITRMSAYAWFMVNDRVSVWGSAGWGTGEMNGTGRAIHRLEGGPVMPTTAGNPCCTRPTDAEPGAGRGPRGRAFAGGTDDLMARSRSPGSRPACVARGRDTPPRRVSAVARPFAVHSTRGPSAAAGGPAPPNGLSSRI